MHPQVLALYKKLKDDDDFGALAELQKLVDNGEPSAAIAIARWHTINERATEALIYVEIAASMGDEFAQAWAADCYQQGIGTRPDGAKAFKLAERAFLKGNEYATRVVASLYFDGKGVSEDRKKAFTLLEDVIATNPASASLDTLYALGRFYSLDGRIAEAIKLYLEAADRGHAYSCFRLGAMNYAGYKMPKDLEAAFRYLKVAAVAKHPDADYVLGRCYEKRNDKENALHYLTRAASKNQFDALRVLAAHLILGTFGIVDVDKAMEYIDKANELDPRVLNKAEYEEVTALLQKALATLGKQGSDSTNADLA